MCSVQALALLGSLMRTYALYSIHVMVCSLSLLLCNTLKKVFEGNLVALSSGIASPQSCWTVTPCQNESTLNNTSA